MKKPKDKRTKEYKEWKRSKGLGDTIEKITEATGIKKVVEWLADGKDCGCNDRQEYLNKKYKWKVNCFTKEDYEWFTEYIKRHSTESKRLEASDVFMISRLSINLFNKRMKIPNCNCQAAFDAYNETVYNINLVYQEYQE
jgi:hypothetical protein